MAATQDQVEQERCPDKQPHGEHEWYGDPPILRRTCPGLPAHLEDSNG